MLNNLDKLELKKKDHISVLENEVKNFIQNIEKDRWYLDCTFGAGGHSSLILEMGGKVVAIDRDINNKIYADNLKEKFKEKFIFFNKLFSDIEDIIKEYNPIFIMYDFGLSSMQIDQDFRGFSFYREGPLKMEMGLNTKSAYDVVNFTEEEELANLIYKFGDERYSRKIAKIINEQRKIKKIETTLELANLIKDNIKGYRDKIHPATRTFQAIRIFVNEELDEIEKSLEKAILKSEKGTKILTISFHSLEDRIVKFMFQKYSEKEKIKNKFKQKDVKNNNILELITKKPITPTREEINNNIRSRSAKLRVAIKI